MDTVTKAVDAATISSTKDDSAHTVKTAQTILNASNLQYDATSQEWRYKAKNEIQMRSMPTINSLYYRAYN